MFLLTAIAFVAIFSLLILVHECGHFWAAKLSGIKVEEFGFGLPPKLWGVKKGETEYTINLIPFGGFVRMLGEDSSHGKKSKRSINNKSLRVQTVVVLAGVFMNFLLAFLLLVFGFLIGIEPLIVDENDFNNAIYNGVAVVEPLKGEISDYSDNKDIQALYLSRFVYLQNDASVFADKLLGGDVIIKIDGNEIITENDLLLAIESKPKITLEIFRPEVGVISVPDVLLPIQSPVITNVLADSPAKASGLSQGERIVSVNGRTIYSSQDLVDFTKEVFDGGGEKVRYGILREGKMIYADITLNEKGLIGVLLSDPVRDFGNLSLYRSSVLHNLVEIHKVKYGIFKASVVAVSEMWRLGRLTAGMFVHVLGTFLSGASVPEGVSGPVGIAQMTAVTIQAGFAAIIRFVALLSLSLGVINFLPIPALDGGRFLFILIQAVTGRRPNPKFEGLIHNTGFILLLLFLAYITFNDVLNLF